MMMYSVWELKTWSCFENKLIMKNGENETNLWIFEN